MSIEWKAIYDSLIEGAEDLNIISFRLSDGSYILAEEIGKDTSFDVILVDLPISVVFSNSGKLHFQTWMFQGTDDDSGRIIPIELAMENIVARSETSTSLKEEYIKYNFLNEFHKRMSKEDFKNAIEHMNSTVINDNIDDLDPLDDLDMTDEDLWKKFSNRLDYPDNFN